MIVCRECGHHNPPGATFCENRDCGAYLEWAGEVVDSGPVARQPGPPRPGPPAQPDRGRDGGGPRRVGRGQVGLTVAVSERELQVEPGEAVDCEITVTNTGQIVDQYSVQVFGEPGQWTTVDPPSINLVPDAEGSAKVTFVPPRRPDVVAGLRPFRLMVTSREDLRAVAFVDGTVTVGAFHGSSSWLQPQYAEGRSGTYQVVVENQGNAPVVARLEATDPRQALILQVAPPALEVPPGARRAARVLVQPRQRPVAGEPVAYPFRVVAQVGWDGPRAMDAQFVHKPSLPAIGRGWLRLLLTLLGALMMVVGAFATWAGDVDGTDLTYEAYVEGVFEADVPSPPDGLSDTLVSVGLVAVICGLLAALGLATQTGKLTRVSAGVAAVLLVVFAFTVADADISIGSGVWVALLGAILALVGGVLALTRTG
jgi:hypothetical protein